MQSMRLSLTILCLAIGIESSSQAKFPDLSSAGSITQKVGFTTIAVQYERPAARGRKIFGDLVPYGEVWRTGAGRCTQLSFTDMVVINNTKVDAGTYALLTIPGKSEWTIILNTDTSLYGTGRYDKTKDEIRFVTKPDSAARFYESFTIDIDIVPNNAIVYLSWEKTQVSFFVNTGADRKTVDLIQQTLLTGKSTVADEYAAAVEYYFFMNKDLDKALKLVGLAISKDPKQPWYHKLKVDVLEKQGNYREALQAALQQLDFLKQHDNELGWDAETLRVAVDEVTSRVEYLTTKTNR
jgi:tetratricopeptide (TPR) repeat protein